jgi:hypothetical protein
MVEGRNVDGRVKETMESDGLGGKKKVKPVIKSREP